MYHRALKKGAKTSLTAKKPLLIPLSLFTDRTSSPLERLCFYLKEERKITFHEIAVLLNRDDRTVWTCWYRRSKKISEKKESSA